MSTISEILPGGYRVNMNRSVIHYKGQGNVTVIYDKRPNTGFRREL